jgi:tetratricopeptide (TPR) repeat protein
MHWLDFANFWFNMAREKIINEGKVQINSFPQLPIFKIGQDLESRLGIEQGMVQKSFEGPKEFLYEDTNDAMGYYQKLLDKDPRNPMVYNIIGEILINKQSPEYPEAIRNFQKALEIFPYYRKAHYDLGMAYIRVKDKNGADGEVANLHRINSRKYAEMLQEEIKKYFSNE